MLYREIRSFFFSLPYDLLVRDIFYMDSYHIFIFSYLGKIEFFSRVILHIISIQLEVVFM